MYNTFITIEFCVKGLLCMECGAKQYIYVSVAGLTGLNTYTYIFHIRQPFFDHLRKASPPPHPTRKRIESFKFGTRMDAGRFSQSFKRYLWILIFLSPCLALPSLADSSNRNSHSIMAPKIKLTYFNIEGVAEPM